jgi:hypothetical protein
VTDVDDRHQAFGVINLVNDSVARHSDSKCALGAGQADDVPRSRIVCELPDAVEIARACCGWDAAEILLDRRLEADALYATFGEAPVQLLCRECGFVTPLRDDGKVARIVEQLFVLADGKHDRRALALVVCLVPFAT